MKVVVYISFLMVSVFSFGQFTGGSGDGYSGLDVDVEITSLSKNKGATFKLKSIFSKGESMVLSGAEKVELIDLNGRVVLLSNSEEFLIPLHVNSGFFVISIYKGQNIFRQRIYVQE